MSSRIYTNGEIANSTRLYFEGINNIDNKEVPTDLTEAAQANVKKFELGVMVPYADGKLNENFSSAIKAGEEMYRAEHPNKEQTSTDLTRTAEMQAIHGNGPKLALVKKEEAKKEKLAAKKANGKRDGYQILTAIIATIMTIKAKNNLPYLRIFYFPPRIIIF